jgi:hypothetical protein
MNSNEKSLYWKVLDSFKYYNFDLGSFSIGDHLEISKK